MHIKLAFATLLSISGRPMDKVDFSQRFACRLRDALIAKGFHSQRSTSGVNIHKLTEMTGYSPQICRKYLKGEVLPDPIKLMDIATALGVTPGWLLFGEQQQDTPSNVLHISTPLMHHLFVSAFALYESGRPLDEVADFLLGLALEVSQINATEAQSMKIIDLALSSASHFGR